jgi:hypothetical protein
MVRAVPAYRCRAGSMLAGPGVDAWSELVGGRR